MDLGSRGNPFTPWGPWSSLALTAAILYGASVCAWLLMQSVGVAPRGTGASDSMLVYSILSDLIGIAAVVKLVDLRAPGQVTPYLALRGFYKQDAWRWLGIAAAFFAVDWFTEEVIRSALEITPPPTWLDDAQPGLLLFVTVVVTGPIFEELLCRGFLMEGLLPTRIGQSGALVVSTLIWALLHTQYDAMSQILVFGSGLIFGLARLMTGSLLLSIVLHMAWNALWMLLSYG